MKLDDAVHDLLWASEDWALKNTGSGLYEASDKQVGFILSLVQGVPTNEQGTLMAILSGLGISNPPQFDELAALKSFQASKLIDKLKAIATPVYQGPATSKQLGFIKSLMTKVDLKHGDVITLFNKNGVFYVINGPGPSEEDIHKLDKTQASKIIDGLTKLQHTAPAKPAGAAKASTYQLHTISSLEAELMQTYDWDVPEFKGPARQAGVKGKTSKDYDVDDADAYIAALQQAIEQEKAKAKAVVHASYDQQKIISSMALALDYPSSPLATWGIKKGNIHTVLPKMTLDSANELIAELTKHMVTPEQLHKLHALSDKIHSHHQISYPQANASLSDNIAGLLMPMPWPSWSHAESQLKVHLTKKDADSLIKDLEKIADPKKATSQQVGKVLALLNQLGASHVKKVLPALGVEMKQLRTDHLKQMGSDEVEALISKLMVQQAMHGY